jgi:predicted nuclease of predicted toxin-antitoxin system
MMGGFMCDTVEWQLNGYDVAWIRTLSPGISDPEVLKFAQVEDRVLLTVYRDYLLRSRSVGSAEARLRQRLLQQRLSR